MFVVLATNTNHDDRVFGPYDSEENAKTASFEFAGEDHLHQFKVLEVVDPDSEELWPVVETAPYEADVKEAPVPDEDEGDEEPETTKGDLMTRAQELDIKGRSSMNKEELQAAIDAAEEE